MCVRVCVFGQLCDVDEMEILHKFLKLDLAINKI